MRLFLLAFPPLIAACDPPPPDPTEMALASACERGDSVACLTAGGTKILSAEQERKEREAWFESMGAGSSSLGQHD